MTDPTVPTPVFVFEYGLTPRQKAWLAGASRAERDALFTSAPVRVAVLSALRAGEGLILQYLPVIHGIPVGLADLTPHDTPAEALADGLAFQECRATRDADRVTLDLDALGLRNAADEYACDDGDVRALMADLCLLPLNPAVQA